MTTSHSSHLDTSTGRSFRIDHVPARALQGVSLDNIATQFQSVIDQGSDSNECVKKFLQMAIGLTNALCTSYFQHGTTQSPELLMTCLSAQDDKNAAAAANGYQTMMTGLAKQVCRDGKAQFKRHDGQLVIVVPVSNAENQFDALGAVLFHAGGPFEPFVVSLQLAASYCTQWWRKVATQILNWECSVTAGVVEMTSQVGQSDDLDAAAITISSQLKQLLNCKQVAVAFCKGGNPANLRLAAISDRSEFDEKSDLARCILESMNEAVITNCMIRLPFKSVEQRAGTLAHQKLLERFRFNNVITVPLIDNQDVIVGAVISIDSNAPDIVHNESFLQTSAVHIANSLEVVRKIQGSYLRRLARKFTKSGDGIKSWHVAAMFGIVALALLLPVNHRVGCMCTVEPVVRRFSVAPHNGILEQATVKPGDYVATGQLLATMDDRELNWDISTQVAERDRAKKERDTNLSQGNPAKMQMAELEVQRLDMKIQLLEHRKSNLAIRSPVDGVILRGDLDNVQGSPVETGQALFEIAPLDQLLLKVSIPEEDLSFVKVDDRVELWLDAFSQRFAGRVLRIEPQAEVVNDQNIFVAEVQLDSTDAALRPGMTGQARIMTGRKSLGWVMFHRPWRKLVDWVR